LQQLCVITLAVFVACGFRRKLLTTAQRPSPCNVQVLPLLLLLNLLIPTSHFTLFYFISSSFCHRRQISAQVCFETFSLFNLERQVECSERSLKTRHFLSKIYVMFLFQGSLFSKF
jgi:hypothetical protein